MTPDEFVERYPRLYHMAEDGSWPSIKASGLLSTLALLDRCDVPPKLRRQLLSVRRPQCVTLSCSGFPDAIIRDQKPMSDARLARCLDDGLTPRDWYELLNGKTFFWVSRERLLRLLNARAYRSRAHHVLTVETNGLVRAHLERLSLATINTGATLFVPPRRGLYTFRQIDDVPLTGAGSKVVECVVDYAVPDIARYVLEVHRHEREEIRPVKS